MEYRFVLMMLIGTLIIIGSMFGPFLIVNYFITKEVITQSKPIILKPLIKELDSIKGKSPSKDRYFEEDYGEY